MATRKMLLAGLLGAAIGVGSFAVAEEMKGGAAVMKLPPGWTQEDMQKCMAAGTPGKEHAMLAKEVGEWTGKSTMTMGSDGETSTSDVTVSYTPVMEGRYFKCDWKGEMGGGPYHGAGLYGFDNVSKQFQVVWIDGHSTGIMNGTGELSADGKTVTWKINFNCPVDGKASVMRQIESVDNADTKTIVMYGPDPKTGKEYKMMSVELKKTMGAAPEASGK